MVHVLYKFRFFLLGNKFVFYVDHMALVYLVNKPEVSGRITRWLLLFLEYEFTLVYKPSKTHVVVNILFRLPDSSKPLGVATLALGSRPRQRGCKGASQREARESHQGLPGV
jgi:hypothetical protein